MKGSILDFSIQHNTGFISGDDNQRYSFNGADWRSERPPSRGDRVDFIGNSTGEASEVYLPQAILFIWEKRFPVSWVNTPIWIRPRKITAALTGL